jgi:hypothetical protein
MKTKSKWDIARPILENDYLKGRVTDDMKRGKVHKMRPEYTAVPINNFGTNFNLMKERYRAFKARANIEHRAFQKDRKLYPPTPGRWDGSEAQRLLKADVKEGVHLTFEQPRYFRASRDEYMAINSKKFRDHVWQEVKGGLASNYWLVKMKKRMESEEANDKPNEDDIDFFVRSEYY